MDIKGKVILITGAGGALGSAMAQGLAKHGAHIIALGRSVEPLQKVVEEITSKKGKAWYYSCDVLNEKAFEIVVKEILEDHQKIDGLVNAAGGNMPGATIMPDGHFYDVETEDLEKVMKLNFMGTMIPSKIVSRIMANQKSGSIVNISSMAASRPLTRVVGYAASKAAIDNYTKWMAVEMATKYSSNIRVNAIAPGFFIGKQNKRLLLEEDGSLTARGKTIIDHTPMGRFGEAEELVGTLNWLMSDASRFVTGIIVPVDGGFSAFSGI